MDNDNFYMATNTATGTTLALRARTRWTNDEVFSGSTYTCQTGYSPTSFSDPTPSPYATWNFDLACYGPGVTPTSMWMSVDFDPSANAGGATLITIPFYYITGIPAAGPYYGSENLGFTYWNTTFGMTFDPNAVGTYTISLGIVSATQTFTDTINVSVVPAPGAAALLVGMLVRPRSRRR